MVGEAGYHGGASAERLWESSVRITSSLTSAFEQIHTIIYLHKSILNHSTHVECVVHSMKFRTGPQSSSADGLLSCHGDSSVGMSGAVRSSSMKVHS